MFFRPQYVLDFTFKFTKIKGNTFDVIKYNEDFEIWATLLNKTRTGSFNLTPVLKFIFNHN